MASETSIANRCLAKIGETRISNFRTDDSKKALVIRDMWDHVRDAMLQNYPWNFSIKRKALALSTDSPEWGYDNKYLLPVDFLSLLEVESNPVYRIEGGYIVTDAAAPLNIKYVSRVEDVGLWDPMFREAFAARLAVECVEIITQSNTKKQLLLAELETIINQAFSCDAIQDPPEELPETEWETTRRQG